MTPPANWEATSAALRWALEVGLAQFLGRALSLHSVVRSASSRTGASFSTSITTKGSLSSFTSASADAAPNERLCSFFKIFESLDDVKVRSVVETTTPNSSDAGASREAEELICWETCVSGGGFLTVLPLEGLPVGVGLAALAATFWGDVDEAGLRRTFLGGEVCSFA
jgi:hypothetical protein